MFICDFSHLMSVSLPGDESPRGRDHIVLLSTVAEGRMTMWTPVPGAGVIPGAIILQKTTEVSG